MQVLIIGGGIAGVTAAETIRKQDADAEITIISEEQHRLYSRVLLPHYIKGTVDRERVFLKPIDWYQKNDIEWVAGERVLRLDPQNKFVETTEGRERPYDKLIICTGGEVRVLDHDIRGVSYFRTLDDADHLLQLIKEQGEECRAGIYGGGFIACEYLNIFRHFGIPMFIAFRSPYFWSKVLEPEAGELINHHMSKHGVDLHIESDFHGIHGTDELAQLKTDKTVHDCTLLGVGIGVQADYSWIKEAGIHVNSGVVTDEFLQTNMPDVFAAGDVAEFNDVLMGRHMHVGNWMNAQMQGRHVANAVLGKRAPFELVSSYATNCLGLEIIFVGDTSKEHADAVDLIGSVQEGGVTQLFEREGRLVGAVLLNRNKDRKRVTEMIKGREAMHTFSN